MENHRPPRPEPPITAKIIWWAELARLFLAMVAGAFAFPLLENYAADRGWLGTEGDRFGWLISIVLNPWVSAFITAGLALLSGFWVGRLLLQTYREGVPDRRIRIRSRDDLDYLGLPILGSTPHVPVKTVADELADHRSGLGESYSLIAAQLQRWATGASQGIVIHVTSLRPADGKSTTAFGLARSLGRIGNRVLLVDGDLRNPSQHRWPNHKREPGLATASTKDAIQRDATLGVDFLAAGEWVSDPVNVLARTINAEWLADLRGRYAYIVIDGPPGFFAENARLSSLADRVLLVVRHDTILYLVRSFVAFLSFETETRIGAVLTQRPVRRGPATVGHYDYAYDYTYGAEKAASIEVEASGRGTSRRSSYYRPRLRPAQPGSSG